MEDDRVKKAVGDCIEFSKRAEKVSKGDEGVAKLFTDMQRYANSSEFKAAFESKKIAQQPKGRALLTNVKNAVSSLSTAVKLHLGQGKADQFNSEIFQDENFGLSSLVQVSA